MKLEKENLRVFKNADQGNLKTVVDEASMGAQDKENLSWRQRGV